jgi:hypothetical protein
MIFLYFFFKIYKFVFFTMYFPAAYPPMTRVSFQHSTLGSMEGVISKVELTSNRVLSTHPDGLVYIIEVNCPNRGLFQIMRQPSDIRVI